MHKFKNRGKLAISSPGESVVGGYTLAGSWLDRGADLHISISLSSFISFCSIFKVYGVAKKKLNRILSNIQNKKNAKKQPNCNRKTFIETINN